MKDLDFVHLFRINGSLLFWETDMLAYPVS